MSHFKLANYKVKEEPLKVGEVQVNQPLAVEVPKVREFAFSTIQKKSEKDYATLKADQKAHEESGDPNQQARARKDSQFSLNPLLRDSLSVDEQERRAIQKQVEETVKSLAEEAKSNAAARGYEEGLNRGYDEAYKKIRAENAINLEKFDELVRAAEATKVEIFKANEKFLIDLIFRIARMIILREVSMDKEYIIRLSKEIVNRVGARNNITLRINSEDFQFIDRIKENFSKAYGEMNNFRVEVSHQVKRGGCHVETEWNAIDADLEAQIQGIYDALLGTSGDIV